MAKGFLVFVSILTLIIYSCLLLIASTIQFIIEDENFLILFLSPLGVIIVLYSMLIIAYSISFKTFSVFYIINGILLGHGLNTFFICIIYRLIALGYVFPPLYASLFSFGIPLLFTIYGLINGHIIQTRNITLTYPNYQFKKKICHLSDLHLGAIYQKGLVQNIVHKVMQINPDVVVITGDLADGTEKIRTDWLTPFNDLSMPILFITGNHEQIMGTSLVLKVVSETNIKHIGLSPAPFITNEISFLGIDYELNLKKRLSEFPKSINPQLPTVLLSHIPQLKPHDLKDYDIFLHLCGHTHGGQVFPFQPLAWAFNKCYNGLYSTDDNLHHVFVSSGLGSSIVPMRIFSTLVIGVITIQGDK